MEFASRRGAYRLAWVLPALILGCDGGYFGPNASQPASQKSANDQTNSAGDSLAVAQPLPPGSAPTDVILRRPLDLAPADAMLTLYTRPIPKDLNPDLGFSPGSPSAMNTVWNIVSQIIARQLKPSEVVGVRIGEAFLEALNYPYVVTLLECAAEPLPNRPTAVRIDRLRIAGIVDTRGRSERFLSLIAKTVDSLTSSAQAQLDTREKNGWRYQVLRDNRLDPDETFEWGQIGDYFIFGFGEGVFERIAAAAADEAPDLSREEWYARSRAERADNAYLELFVGADRIRELLDPHVRGSASDFFKAWDADGLERAHWSFGLTGRAMFCIANFRIDNSDVRRVYADQPPSDAAVMSAIPKETNYAVWGLPVERFLNRFFEGLVVTREPQMQAQIRRDWARIQQEYQFDAQRDVLDHLGDTIVQHKYPLHPLRIPVCVTTLIEIRSEPQIVARTIDRMCRAWQQGITENINKGIVVPATLTQEDGGIWFLNLGLAGPAWIVTDKYIVASWSPQALREYLATVGDAAGNILRP